MGWDATIYICHAAGDVYIYIYIYTSTIILHFTYVWLRVFEFGLRKRVVVWAQTSILASQGDAKMTFILNIYLFFFAKNRLEKYLQWPFYHHRVSLKWTDAKYIFACTLLLKIIELLDFCRSKCISDFCWTAKYIFSVSSF